MALPAGRYGVTKNQLLKIKKLPMNTIKLIEELTEKFNLLGTAAFKNSTSVVTESSDLVESGAVKDIIGWGNKNLLPYPFKDTTKTKNGVTFTDNGDGTVTINSAEGASSTTDFYIIGLWGITTPVIPAGRYKLISDNLGDAIKIYAVYNVTDFPNNSDINAVNGITDIFIRVLSGTPINNVTLNPMLLRYDCIDDTYEPYHASVDESKCDNSVIGTVEGANASKTWSVGEHFIKDGQFKEVTQPISSGGAINDSNTVDKPIADCLATTLLNLSKHTDVTILQNDSKKFGNIVSFRVQFQVTADIANKTDIITCSDIGHPHFGTCEALDSNLGNTVPILITNSSSSVLFNCRAAMPTGYYVLNYTFII